MTTQQTEWIPVFAPGDPFSLALAKSLLDEASIPYVTRGETLQDLVQPGRIGLGFSQVAGPIELLVPEDHLEEAIMLCQDIEKYGQE